MLAMLLAADVPCYGAPPLEVSVEPERVSIEEATPGGRVAVVGLARRARHRIPGFRRWEEVVTDADGDGRVEVSLDGSVNPAWSIWVAVDLGSGEWGVGGWPDGETGEGGEGGEEAAGPGGLPTGESVTSGAGQWRLPVGILEVLVVRLDGESSGGAWGGSVWDGGSADGDGVSDGSATVTPESLRAVGASGPAPESFAAGDVLIAIQPRSLAYGITTVAGETEEEVSR